LGIRISISQGPAHVPVTKEGILANEQKNAKIWRRLYGTAIVPVLGRLRNIRTLWSRVKLEM
jgi:hypothetical protein